MPNSEIQRDFAPIEIFPKKMDVKHGSIIRKIAPEVPAIPVEIAGAILMDFANTSRCGRKDAQLTALESLGLCWLCLTTSRLRLPIHLEILHATLASSLRLKGNFPKLKVPTFFGLRPIQISNRMSRFLYALSQIPSKTPRTTILQRPLRTLSKSFEKALKSVSPDPKLGNITYISLLSPPLHFNFHRYQPK